VSNRPAIVSQADVARVIRACRKEGLVVDRIIVKGDRVEVEAVKDSGEGQTIRVEREKDIVL